MDGRKRNPRATGWYRAPVNPAGSPAARLCIGGSGFAGYSGQSLRLPRRGGGVGSGRAALSLIMNKRHNSIIPVLPHILQRNLEYTLTCNVAAISGRLNENWRKPRWVTVISRRWRG